MSRLIAMTLSKDIKIYRFKSPRIKGSIFATYTDGYLVSMELELNEPLTQAQSKYLFEKYPYTEDAIPELTSGTNLQAEPIKAKSVQEKLVLFCAFYKQWRGIPYTPAKLEKANVKNVPMDEALLTTFFSSKAWWAVNNYSLANYIMRINHVRDAARNGLEVALTFPSYYDAKYAEGLEQESLRQYHQHLRSIGFVYKQIGNGWAWVKNK